MLFILIYEILRCQISYTYESTYYLIFLDFKIYLNKCRRAKTLPTKEDAVLTIQRTMLMIFQTNPNDENLIDGLLPIITGRGLSMDQAKNVVFNANNFVDTSKILFESKRQNLFLSSKTSLDLIINMAGIDLVARRVQEKFTSYAAITS